MGVYNNAYSVEENFPNILYNKQKFILPIYQKFHTTLLPDSKLNTENEVDFLDRKACKYALQKVYISQTFERNINKGDIILFYCMGQGGSRKKYSSVITTCGIITDVIFDLESKEDLFNHCQNRTVFSTQNLNEFAMKLKKLIIIKFIDAKSLKKRPTLEFLWNNRIVKPRKGPRPFEKITDEQFDIILKESKTDIKFMR